jgi:hypothetical protein
MKTKGTKTMPSMLEQFFVHKLHEGPRDKAFKPSPEVPVKDNPDAIDPGGDMAPEPGMEDPNLGQDDSMTQDVAKMSASSLNFFAKNVQSAVSKPGARQSFESDYQKLAADWAKDLTKLFEKVLKLQGHVDLG